MDVIRWMADEQSPVAISAHGVTGLINDDRTIPDNMEVTFEFRSGFLAQFHIYEACGATGIPGGEIEICGTKGTAIASVNGYQINPSKPGQFQTWRDPLEAEKYNIAEDPNVPDRKVQDSTDVLIQDFLECIQKRRQPLCPLREGHRSTLFAHLANISIAVNRRIEWDPATEMITNCPEAQELMHYEYRQPWEL